MIIRTRFEIFDAEYAGTSIPSKIVSTNSETGIKRESVIAEISDIA